MKKLLSILLVLVLCTGLMALTASAEGGYAMKVSSHELKAGTKEVTVTVTLTENAGIATFEVTPIYDDEVLELVSIEGKGLPNDINYVNFTGGSWIGADGKVVYLSFEDHTYTGEFITMKFKVLQEKATAIDLLWDGVNAKEDQITFDITAGTICPNHKLEKTAATAGDCQTKGTETWSCTVCGKSEVKETKLGNHVNEEKTTPATCEADGKIETVCTLCGKVSGKATKLPKTGHDWELTGTTASKCGEAGTNTYTCQNDPSHTKTESVPALEHQWDEGTVTTPATCDTKGVKTYTCKRGCGETKTEAIKELGHTKGEAVTENEVAATCEKGGSKDTVVYCTVCKAELSRKTETSKALGHKWDNGKVTGEAKCGEPGEMTYTCQNDPSHTKTEKMDALAHILDAGKQTTAPTCTEKGVMTYTCTRNCGHTETKEIPALGHTKAEAVKENEVAPTCTEAGSYDEVVYCSVCNEKLSTKTVSVKATGHAWATKGTVKTPATCYAEGVMTYACTNGCGETKDEAIKKTEHTVTKWTHEDAVYCVGTCDVAECGAAVKERHDVKKYEQNEKGEYIGTCTTCGQTNVNKGDMIPAGDITPMLIMGGVAVFGMLAAAAYVTSRKFAK